MLNEIEAKDISLSSFKVKKELHPKFWPNGKLNSRVRLRLMDIADDFIDNLSVNWVKPKDVILTGSIANYNWSRYSDIDLHILIDFTKVYSKKKEFVEDYFDSKKNLWASEHKNLKIYGFNVEVYVEDSNDNNPSTGRYSLYKNKWLVEPNDFQNAEINQEYVKRQAANIMTKVDEIEDKLSKETDLHKIEVLGDKVSKIFDKAKKARTEGLRTSKKEMSSGNIVYKIIRRAGYVDKIRNIINKSYDKVNSIDEKKTLNEAFERQENVSAGILPYRMSPNGNVEVFMGFPGQPSNPIEKIPNWMNRWNILKGHAEKGEDLKDCAVREFCEECGASPSMIDANKLVSLGNATIMDGWKFFCYALDVTNDNRLSNATFRSNMVDDPYYLQQNGGKPYPEIEKYAWMNTNSLGDTSPYEKIFIEKVDEICKKNHPSDKEPKKTIVMSDSQAQDIQESLNNELIAYHGSTHNFDKFDNSFMGSGEGAQVHGWGTYVTVNDKVGKNYAHALSWRDGNAVKYIGDKNNTTMYENDAINEILDIMKEGQSFEDAFAYCKRTWRNPYEYSHMMKRKALSKLNPNDFVTTRNFYEVEIPDNDGRNYLEEGEGGILSIGKIVKGLEDKQIFKPTDTTSKFAYLKSEASNWLKTQIKDKGYAGHYIYDALSKKLGSPKNASQFLSEIGFVGIHYNGRRDGECYVIFNPSDIKITNHFNF